MADDTQLPLDMPGVPPPSPGAGRPGRLQWTSGAVTVLPGLSRRDAQPESWTGVAAWRGLTPSERRARWEDLAAWVDWLIEAYRLPPRPWRSWWTCPGACEELSAMRDWHRELVDTQVAALDEERSGAEGLDERIEWHRREQSVRREQARSHVDWHDALLRVLTRLVGDHTEQKPLLLRESELTDRSQNLRDTEARDRERGFRGWIDELVSE